MHEQHHDNNPNEYPPRGDDTGDADDENEDAASDEEHEPTPDEDAAIARVEFAAGNFVHAAHHLACALSSDPLREDWLALLDELIAATDDPLSLAPMGEQSTFFAVAAVRAYILFKLDQISEAFGIIMEIVSVKPDVPYAVWAEKWLSTPTVVERIDPNIVTHPLWRWLETFAGSVLAPGEPREMVAQVLPILKIIRDRHPTHVNGWLLSAAMLRKTAQFDEAMTCATKAYELQPSWLGAISMAEVYRAIGDTDKAIEAFETALDHQPDDLSARLDLGDMLAEVGRFEESAGWYREVLDKNPDHPWANPSLLATTIMMSESTEEAERWLQRLEDYAKTHPNNHRAADLLEMFSVRRTAYLGWLPEPGDATCNVLRQLSAEWEEKGDAFGDDSTVELSTSHLEAPSARLAFASEMQRLGGKLKLTIKVDAIPQPDPRVPSGPVEYLLWEYDGTDPKPAQAPPTAEVAEIVAQLAQTRFNAAEWYYLGREIAQKLGGREALPSLLGVMVHPPPTPEWLPGWIWVQRVQVAAAMIVTGLDAGWNGSLRKQVLVSLARGPMDWTTEAAIIALTQIALEEPELEPAIHEVLIGIFGAMPRDGYVCYLYALLANTLRLPGLPDDIRQQFSEWKANLETPSADDPTADSGSADSAP